MPPVAVDRDLIHRVETLVETDSPAYRNPSSFGMWIGCLDDLSPSAFASLIETPLLALYGSGTTSGLRSAMPDEGRIIRSRYSKPLLDPQPVPHEVARNLPGQTGSLLPPDIAMVVSLRSDTAGPAFRGRFYLPAIRFGATQTSGLFTTAQVTTIKTAVEDFNTALLGLTPECRLVNISRFHTVNGNTVLRPDPLYVDVTNIQVDEHADVQRRRGVR